MNQIKCDECNKEFIDIALFNNHEHVKEVLTEIKCDFCELTFADKVYRNRHVKRAHLENTKISL